MNLINAGVTVTILSSLTGCASNHHLVFFTNTTIGLEVSSDPNVGSPAKFVLGYKRQEGVLDPLIPNYDFIEGSNGTMTEPKNGDTNIVMTPTGTAIPKGQITKSHSVLAKMNFGATGGGTGAASAQFFATGKAAELLAQAPGISGALSGDPKNNTITSLDLNEKNGNAVFAHLDDVYRMLSKSITKDEETDTSKEIKEKVDALDDGFFKVTYKNYTWTDGKKVNISISDYDIKKDKHEFPNVYQYLETLSNSRNVIKEAITKNNITTSGITLTDAEKKQMVDDVETFLYKYNEGINRLSSNKDILAMIDHVYKNILLKKTTKKVTK